MERATFIAKVNAFIDTLGKEETTGPELIELFTDLAQSTVFQDEAVSLEGLGVYNPATEYEAGMAAIINGAIHICVEDTTGALALTKWRKLPVIEFLFTFDEWSVETAYNTGDERRYKYKLYRALVDSTGSNPITSGDWAEVPINNGTYGNDWATGYYLTGQVISYQDSYLRATGNFRSVDITNDIATGNFVNVLAQEYKKRYEIEASTIELPGEFSSELYIDLDNIPTWAIPVMIQNYTAERFTGGGVGDVTMDVLVRDQVMHTTLVSTSTETLKGKITIPGSIEVSELGTAAMRIKLTCDGDIRNLTGGNVFITILYKVIAWDGV